MLMNTRPVIVFAYGMIVMKDWANIMFGLRPIKTAIIRNYYSLCGYPLYWTCWNRVLNGRWTFAWLLTTTTLCYYVIIKLHFRGRPVRPLINIGHGLRILYFGFVPRRLAAEIGGRLVRRWRIRHGQYERLLPGRLMKLPAQLAKSEQHGRLLLRAGSSGRVDHGRQVRVHQLRVARRQPINTCNVTIVFTLR